MEGSFQLGLTNLLGVLYCWLPEETTKENDISLIIVKYSLGKHVMNFSKNCSSISFASLKYNFILMSQMLKDNNNFSKCPKG